MNVFPKGKNINDILPETVRELWLGELLFGIVCELIVVWFIKDKMGFTMGLGCGVLLAMAGTYHMWWAIDRSLDMGEKGAGKFVGSQYSIRYFVLVAVIAVLYFSGWCNAFAAFVGYIGMKPAAYIQPLIHKIIRR